MNRSWTSLTFTGYEVKTSRADFLGDQKWPDYLPLCHRLYFVCPYGLIQADEVPDQAGVLWASKGGTRLYTKRHAPRREIDPPVDLLLYVLMCRATLQSYGERETEQNAAFWRRWLEEKEEKRRLGYEVSKGVRAKVTQMETDLQRAKAESAQGAEFLAYLKSHGIQAGAWNWQQRLEDTVLAKHPVISPKLVTEVRALAAQAQALVKKIDGDGSGV